MENPLLKISFNKVNGVFIFQNDEDFIIRVVELHKKGDEIKLGESYEKLIEEDFQFNDFIKSKEPSILFLHAHSMLHKLSEANLEATFPNLNKEEFYIDSQQLTSGNYHTIIRKLEMKSLLNQFGIAEEQLLTIILNPAIVSDHLPYFNLESNSLLNCHPYLLKVESGQLIDIQLISGGNQETDTYLNFGDERIGLKYLLPLSAALEYFVGNIDSSLNKGIAFENSFLVWASHKIEKIGVKYVLSIMLAIALIIALLYTNTYQTNQELSAEMSIYNSLFQEYDQLKKNADAKVSMINELGWTRQERLSKVVNVITESIKGDEIELTKLHINPYDEELYRKESILKFETLKIEIKGTCADAKIFDGWMNQLAQRNWVDEIINPQYGYDEYQGTGSFSLTLRLNI